MSVRDFVHDVLASVARVDEPFTRASAARPLPAWLVSLTRTSRAFAGRSGAVGGWPADLSAAVTRDTPAFGHTAGRRVPLRMPARGGLAVAMAVVVAMLVVPTAFAWGLRDSVYEPGGVGGPALPTASPPQVDVPPDPGFQPKYDTRIVIPGADAGKPRTTHVDLHQGVIRAAARDLTVEARGTTTTITAARQIAGANLSPDQDQPADCLRAIEAAPFAGGQPVSGKRGGRFCLHLPATDESLSLVVHITVEDVGADGSLTLRLVAWTVTAPIAFSASTSLPMCATLTGTGTRPADGEVALFVRSAADLGYYYEQVVTFDVRGRWTATVRLGGPEDVGRAFVLAAVAVTPAEAAALQSTAGGPSAVPTLPGEVLAQRQVIRTADAGTC
ncbi:hypothetical protein DFJ67_7478 [Asanoa ferruginea]|uniref:Uncharacterized protein n=1 Tax=Asanoa ferruginea TaxID=53367 RepID=A0A3D9ZXQ8_9ACTN|nr:hypothetical protein [Asanoa ferruginea]REG01395.1 hypothetical protein DFJ67_7478 [Asanoa ferruginea]GIF47980.1 hypothetical protein Afe04nite_25190 [Asanoa ferruginea]